MSSTRLRLNCTGFDVISFDRSSFASVLALFALAGTEPAWAQRGASEPSLAQANRTATFDIPAQPLAQALTAFGRQSGLQVAVDTAVAAGKTSGAVVGSMTLEQALRQLLAGTGLSYQFTSANAVTVAGAAAAPAGVVQLDPVRVQGTQPPPQAEIGNQSPPFAGGQVARGGKVGLLGNLDYMNMPFSETTYTEKFIKDQQARTLTDALASDPTVRSGWPDGNVFDDRLVIRGIQVTNTDFGFGGIFGILPGQTDMTGVERIEVFRGPTAFLNGALPNAVGGTVNIVPKRATSEPITQASALYMSDSRFGGSADVGRRFGPDDSLGLRANATYTSGSTSVSRQTAERLALTLGFDYRSDSTRLDADIGYLQRDIGQFRGGMFLAAGIQLPPAPYARNSSYQPWERLQGDELYGALRFEHDITPDVTGFLKIGAKRGNLTTVFFNQNIINYNGNTTTLSAGQFLQNNEVLSAQAGVRARFATGGVSHEAALAGDYRKTMTWTFNNPLAISQTSNIYGPTIISAPNLFGLRQDAPLTSDSVHTSIGLVDMLTFWQERAQIILGTRLQRLQTANYSAITGLPTQGNDQSVMTPSVGFVVKPLPELALYGNYIEGLQQGPTAGAGLRNAGETFPPFVARQFEIGAKVDFGNFGATLSAFQINQPSSFVDFAGNMLVTDGQQRNRGIEFMMFGEPLAGLKVLGGFTLLEATLTNTAGGLANGNTPVGTSPFQLALSLDWDTPFVKGLGLSGRVVHVGPVYLNTANTQSAPPWTRFDLGVRYTFERPFDSKPISLRANVINLFDANYWIATNAFFAQNQPRTFLLSLSADF